MILLIFRNLKRPKVIKGQIERQVRKEGRLKALPESGLPMKSLSSYSFYSHSNISGEALSKTISYRDPEIALDICNRDFIVSPKDAEAPLLSSIQLKS